jgi:hypothetical protein
MQPFQEKEPLPLVPAAPSHSSPVSFTLLPQTGAHPVQSEQLAQVSPAPASQAPSPQWQLV